jgi:hypothetical protein
MPSALWAFHVNPVNPQVLAIHRGIAQVEARTLADIFINSVVEDAGEEGRWPS